MSSTYTTGQVHAVKDGGEWDFYAQGVGYVGTAWINGAADVVFQSDGEDNEGISPIPLVASTLAAISYIMRKIQQGES